MRDDYESNCEAEWKSGQPGNGKAKELVFDATGLIDKNGSYDITLRYTDGEQDLKIDGYETGASFKIKAMAYGDTGNDSKGLVSIKRAGD